MDGVATAPFKDESYREMLKSLLADRFDLAVHAETREKRGYVLISARGGAKLPPPVDSRNIMFNYTGGGEVALKATTVTMAKFAGVLSSRVGAIVVDETGIAGSFDVSFQFTPESPVNGATAADSSLPQRLEPDQFSPRFRKNPA